MSYMRNQPNGLPSYLNGAGRGSATRLGQFDFDTTPDTSADERSRSRGPGGYGGMGGANQKAHVQVPARVERAHRRSRDGYADWSASRSRSRGATVSRYGAAGGQVDEIMRYINQQWAFMASDECIPIKVALQLMDSSSLGLQEQYDQFQATHEQLQNALKVIVNEHHQGFNSSIGTFHKIQAAIHTSQHRVRSLRAGLMQSKQSLSTAKPEMRAFATTSQNYDQMLHILGQIEQLQRVPELLEAQISEKRFLGAVATLQEALALIRKPEMGDIGALSDLRVYLGNQEHSLTDILIEELHSHLYLKSPYCEERWKAHSRRELSSTSVITEEDRAMHTFLDHYDGSQLMHEDTARNPEADTFHYIQLLIESLNQLGKLDAAVDAVDHRMPVELFKVVERSHSEVEQRHPTTMRSVATRHRHQALGTIGGGPDSERRDVLEDLLTTLYAKFEAIAEGHRVLHDVMGAIIKRDGLQQNAATLNRSFRELWNILQSEIRSLLHDHLASSEAVGAQRSKDSHASQNIFRPQPRDRTRKIFALSKLDAKSTDLMAEKEDLEFILKSSVPGLVNASAGHGKKDRDDEILADKSATGHKLLVEPSLFNMGVLLPPSLAFLTRLKDIVPPHSSGVVASTLTSFLDDFLVNVFYPQLEETLDELCGRSINNADAFQPDPDWQSHSKRPVFKGTIKFFEIMELVCSMLDSLPHEQSFSQLVVAQLRAYYDKCFSRSKALLQRAMAQQDGQAGIRMRLAADLATAGELNDCAVQLLNFNAMEDETAIQQALVLAEKESALLINYAKTHRIEEADLITDRKSLAALCTLHVSMKWLAAKCSSLRYISPKAVDIHSDVSPRTDAPKRRWTSSAHTNALDNAPQAPYLPLDENTAQEFDAVVGSFTEVSSLVLRTLHVDLRLHLLQGIYAALDKSYRLNQPFTDPDAQILDLSNSLASYDTDIATHLLPTQYTYLALNLHVLANNSFISLVSNVRDMDDYGNERMQRNVLVLQQRLKSMEPPRASGGLATSGKSKDLVSLARAGRFWQMGEAGCATIVGEGSKEGYERSELKYLIRLCWAPERDAVEGGVEEWVARLG
ncbi:Sec8 exocyst complex component [Teratosphaeria nubilosa]|uniref:Exocyst complex component Sec8 n=1 Tax=Teratosphaeria nubilosa TaxID=161662 RepID=A0A6G1L6N1_9PEZI|nr:Sec8 exocyst complex component [Teratosphaeria nubilosa]